MCFNPEITHYLIESLADYWKMVTFAASHQPCIEGETGAIPVVAPCFLQTRVPAVHTIRTAGGPFFYGFLRSQNVSAKSKKRQFSGLFADF